MFHKQKIKVYFTSGHTLTVRTTGFEFTWQCDNQIWRMIRDQHPMTHFNTYGGMTWAQHVFMFRLCPTLWGRIYKLFGK